MCKKFNCIGVVPVVRGLVFAAVDVAAGRLLGVEPRGVVHHLLLVKVVCIKAHWFLKIGPSPASFCLFSSFQTNITIFTAK